MSDTGGLRILFIINKAAGKRNTDWTSLIRNYFADLAHTIELFELPQDCDEIKMTKKIKEFRADQVVAVGGDGTVRLVAASLIKQNVALGILPAGSANGLAKELGISEVPYEALSIIGKGHSKKIHVAQINDKTCIHLSDIGFNAYAMQGFQQLHKRGMWGYLRASLKVFIKNPVMQIEMHVDQKAINITARMVVIANATKYGTGALINPIGRFDDDMFEVIAVKKISLREMFKMFFSHAEYDLDKTEIFQAHTLTMHSAKKVHFQVDGEYLGMVHDVKAVLIRDALEIIIPEMA